jgi:putative transposase
LIEHDNKSVSVREQCELLELNRSSLYYKKADIDAWDLELMKLIDEQYMKTPFFGSRRMTATLKKSGYSVNRKRVRRLMELMGIEAVYRKPRTSKPTPGHKIYPYLLRDVQIDHPDQAWAADITYVPMRKGFLYLVAIIDWHSRYVVSWRLSNSMDKSFCVEALEDALAHSKPGIFNTDQGSQFTSDSFTDVLKESQVAISMDGKGRFLDNIFVERLWRSLKYEEVYLKAYADIREARASIAEWIRFYNFERPHQALDYNTPWEVYQQVPRFAPEGGASTTVTTATAVAVATVAVFEDDNLNHEEQNRLDRLAPSMVSIKTRTPEAEIHLSS